MSSAERQTVRSDRSLALAERRAHEARERALRAGNAGRPTVGARYARAGLRQLGWKEDGEQPKKRGFAYSFRLIDLSSRMYLA